MTNTATLIRPLRGGISKSALYRLSQPLHGYSYVVVSALNDKHAHETYIFGADAKGKILDWVELPGSLRGADDHAAALQGAGYDFAP